MHIHDLDTPAVVIDLDVLERNIQNMASHCAGLDADGELLKVVRI